MGLASTTSAEQFWYYVQCVAFGAGYFSKVISKKALSEKNEAQVPEVGAPVA